MFIKDLFAIDRRVGKFSWMDTLGK